MESKEKSELENLEVSPKFIYEEPLGRIQQYRRKITDMVGQVEEERFLKAIYISVSEYLEENEPG